MILLAFECYPCGLSNAATSRILANPALIPMYKQIHIFVNYVCVNVSLFAIFVYNKHYLIIKKYTYLI